MDKAGYVPERQILTQRSAMAVQTLKTQVVLDEPSYNFMHSDSGRAKYDAVYGLTRQLADELKDYVKYTESYDELNHEWTCRVEVKVVKECTEI